VCATVGQAKVPKRFPTRGWVEPGPYRGERGRILSGHICGRRCDTGEVVTLRVEERKITAIHTGAESCSCGGPDVWLSPGFFDIQVNGYGGQDFNLGAWNEKAPVPDLPALRTMLARSGTALFCPTITTNSFEAIQAGLSTLAQTLRTDRSLAQSIPGIHLEGPYIATEDGPRGAHPLEHVRDPDWEEFQRWQEAAEGRIRIVTLAPEREGALPFIEKLAEAGLVVALGHTGAEPETIREAVRAGAKLSTHLGNGAHSMLRRHPNYLWEQLAEDRLIASIIADGHHLPAAVVKCFARGKGADRLILVSDAVALGGLPPGVYNRGRHEVLPSGKITLAGTPYLAGAGHLLDTCVANTLRFTDLSPAQVCQTVTANPARLLGMDNSKGKLEIGCDADLTLFRIPELGPLEIVATFCGGDMVYAA
jgi:N-acetylglucosamine-6-phosphate deacetylase